MAAATSKTVVMLLSYALLECILIIMLLCNSIFSYLIRKFATYYTLKPPCVWCSTIDHLFDPNTNISPYQYLVCEAHATEFLNHYHCSDGQKLSNENGYVCRNRRCSCCSMNFEAMSVDRSLSSASKIEAKFEGNGMVEFMDLPVENKSPHIQVFDHIIPLEWTDSSTSCSRGSSIKGDEDQEATLLQSSCRDEEDKKDKVITIDSLMAELKAERLVVCRLYIELDEERKASAVAANQAMVMITRLQEEKVAVQLESIQNQRMMDEQAEYDHEVFQLLNELVMKLEKDNIELENELEKYKEKVTDYEGKTKEKMIQKCPHDSCCITKESLVDIKVLDSKCLRSHDESVVEFETEKRWLLNELKDLDESLMTLTNDLNEDRVRKTSLEEDNSYKENELLHVFDKNGINDKAEASHSAWTISMF